VANALITTNFIVAEALRIAHNKSAFLGRVNTQYSDLYAKEGGKVGNTINIRKPVSYTTRSGPVANLQDTVQTTVPLVIQPEIGVDFYFSDYDLTLSVDEFSNNFIKPAAIALATRVDMTIASLFTGIPNFVGTPGTSPATADAVLAAGEALDNNAAPRDDERMLMLGPKANRTLVNGLAGYFNDQAKIGKQYRDGTVGVNTLGFDIGMSQNMPVYTVGPQGGTPLVNGASQGLTNASSTDNPNATTTTLVTNGWTAAAAPRVVAGDVITIAGVFGVNPDGKQPTGALRQFVVVNPASSDGSGNASITISPAIIAGGAYQNVTARPASGAAITVVSGTANTSYLNNIFWHKDAITFATVDMEMPKNQDMAMRETQDGVSMRFVRFWDGMNNRRVCRFDILAAYGLVRPEWAGRLTS
jgi:hypothetical protein